MNIHITLLIFFCLTGFAQTRPTLREKKLLDACAKREPYGCEALGAYYSEGRDWDKAQYVGEALCTQDKIIGCTYAGLAFIAKGKVKEGNTFLVKSCDKFEPFACRSLGRLMKKAGDGLLSHMYFRRACHYGLKEICQDLQKNKILFTRPAREYITKLKSDCIDTQYSSCKDRLKQLNECDKMLTKEDCNLIPGFLSIYFRARLMQAEAKLLLTTILAGQKRLKEYSHDMEILFKDFTSAENYHYVAGFMKSCSGEAKSNTLEIFPNSYKNMGTEIKTKIKSYLAKGKKQDCYSSGLAFEAFAVGNLDPQNPGKLDVWKINHDGNLIQIQEGLPD